MAVVVVYLESDVDLEHHSVRVYCYFHFHFHLYLSVEFQEMAQINHQSFTHTMREKWCTQIYQKLQTHIHTHRHRDVQHSTTYHLCNFSLCRVLPRTSRVSLPFSQSWITIPIKSCHRQSFIVMFGAVYRCACVKLWTKSTDNDPINMV